MPRRWCIPADAWPASSLHLVEIENFPRPVRSTPRQDELLQAVVGVRGRERRSLRRVVVEDLGAERVPCGRQVGVGGRTRRVGLAFDVLRIRTRQQVEGGRLAVPRRGDRDGGERAQDADDDDRQQGDRHHRLDQAHPALWFHFNAPTRPYMAEMSETAMNPTTIPTATVITGSIKEVMERIR